MNTVLKATLSIGATIIGIVITMFISTIIALAVYGHNFKGMLLFMAMTFVEFLIGLYFVLKPSE